MDIILIAAIGKNREIGRNNELLWDLPGDLPRFKEMTMGSPLIMGRKTFDSIGRPLPGRTNIILTRNLEFQMEGTVIAYGIDHALEQAYKENAEKVFVVGGGEIYALFLPIADKLELTIVDDEPEDTDTYFPDYSEESFIETARVKNHANELDFDYVTLEREEEKPNVG